MKRLRLLLCVFLVEICASALAIDLPPATGGVFGFGGHLLRNLHSKPEEAASDYEKYYSQKLDNFDSANSKTFQQRYFVNTQWNSTAVNVLYLEGESPASSSSVSDSNLPHVALAKDLKATVYCLEHRFYGASQPFQANTRHNLGFLSSRQAVEDIRNFVNAQNSATGQQNPKWIIVGASYAGALALWFRQKYPTLSAGVVSSSPVVIPTNDFYAYERNVEVSYSNYSYECWHGIKFAALSIRNEIQYEEGVDRLNQHLKLVPPIDDYRVDYKSFQNMFSNVMKLFEIPVLYNKVNVGPFATKAGIDDVCKIMSDETVKDIDRVIQWAKYLYTAVFGHPDNFPGIPNSYENLVTDLKNITLSDQWRASARSWFWQQCNEFGQFVTTDNSHGLFAATVPNDFFNGLCSEVFYGSQFAFTITNMTANVKQTASYFGASNVYKGTNSFIVNGDSDPWISLAPNVTTASSSAVYVVQGVGHNAVLQPATNTDPVSLKMARNLLNRKAKSWVSSNSRAQRVEQKPDIAEDVQEHRGHFAGHDHPWPKIKNWDAEIVYHAPHPNAERYAKEEILAKKMEQTQQPVSMKRITTMTDVLSRKLGAIKPQNNIHGIKRRYLNTSYIVQDVDHFDPKNNLKFAQQFLFNDIHQRDKDAPRFLMLGGEAAIDWPYVNGEAFAYYNWGSDFKAVLYALEHRYYGYSEPFSNTSVSNLRWMNTEQVLADTAVFVKAINKNESLSNPRWVIFGGSYPGNLAALFRYRYPDLSVGAVASSAPLQARTDFTEYMQAVERDIKRYANEGCPGALRRFFAWTRKKMNTRTGRKEVKAAFCIENNWDENYVDEKDAELLLANWVFRIDHYIQNHWALNYLCRFFKNFDDTHGAEKTNRVRELFEATRNISATLGIPDPFDQARPKVQKFKTRLINDQRSLVRPDGGDGNYDGYDDDTGEKSSDEDSGSPEVDCYCNYCSWISYDAVLKELQDIYSHRYVPGSGEDRLWFWLTCSQWGYAESTNYGYNHFESALPVNHILDICYDVFGAEFNRARVDGGVRNTNYLYGGQDNYNGTNVVFVNGSEDPWSWLGVYKPLNPDSVTSILIEGTSHCADMMREEKTDVKVLKDARKQIKDTLIKWLKKN